MFATYTETNCRRECLSYHIAKTCGCVPFYMISKCSVKLQSFKYERYFLGNETTRACKSLDRNCYFAAEESFTKYSSDCVCYPQCEELKFIIEKRKADFSE